MPFKHNVAHRHHIRRGGGYRVTNWAAYEAGLRRRGDLMFWVDEDAWIIFYNGATPEAVWSIGWMLFDQGSFEIIARSEQPLIAPPGIDSDRNIAFAASCVIVAGDLHLYFSYNDRSLQRAVVVWNDAPELTNRVFVGG